MNFGLTLAEKRSNCAPSPARWRSGDVADCKSAYPGSIPGRASKFHCNTLEILGYLELVSLAEFHPSQ